MNTQKKITKATIKSFIRKNKDEIMVLHTNRFDAYCDGVRPVSEPFERVEFRIENGKEVPSYLSVPLDIRHNIFKPYNKNGMIGFEVYNCCGTYVVAIPQK